MVIRIPGRKEQVNLENLQRNLKMPRGMITRYEIQSRLFKIKDELKEENAPSEQKYLADQYLNKVLDCLNSSDTNEPLHESKKAY